MEKRPFVGRNFQKVPRVRRKKIYYFYYRLDIEYYASGKFKKTNFDCRIGYNQKPNFYELFARPGLHSIDESNLPLVLCNWIS